MNRSGLAHVPGTGWPLPSVGHCAEGRAVSVRPSLESPWQWDACYNGGMIITGGFLLAGILLFVLSVVLGSTESLSRIPAVLSLMVFAMSAVSGLAGLGRAVGVAALVLGGLVAALLFGWL